MKRVPYSAEEVALIQERAEAGIPLEEIRKEILEKFQVNRPEAAIKVFAKKAGLKAERLVKKHGGKITVTLTCAQCGKKNEVTTTKPEIYTPEVRKTWTCSFCPKNSPEKPA